MVQKLTRRQIVRSAATGLLFTVTPLAALAKAAAAPQFVAVRIWPASAYTRITLEASSAMKYKHFTLDNPARLVVDIEGATLNNVLQTISSKVQQNDPYIANIRVGQNPKSLIGGVLYTVLVDDWRAQCPGELVAKRSARKSTNARTRAAVWWRWG